jgi:Flp pilus assembly protein TadG
MHGGDKSAGVEIGQARRFGASQSGAAAVEFAFIVPVLLAMLLGAIEFGRVMYSKVAFEYAVAQASRFGRVTKAAGSDKVKKALSSNLLLLDPSHLKNVSFSEVVNADTTRTATLSASYQIDFMVPILETNSLTISKSITFLRP